MSKIISTSLFIFTLTFGSESTKIDYVEISNKSKDLIVHTVASETPLFIHTFTGDSLIYEADCKISPNGIMIASLVTTRYYINNIFKGYQRSMLVFNSKGKIIFSFPEIFQLDWDPHSQYIVGCGGINYEAHDFIYKGLFIFDLTDLNKIKTNKISTIEAFDVKWAINNNFIYINKYTSKKLEIYSYDPDKKILKESNLKGIYLSFDGKYCLAKGGEGEDPIIYDSITNNQIVDPIIKNNLKGGLYAKWLDIGSYLVVGDYYGEKKIINISRKILLSNFTGKLLNYDSKNQIIYSKEFKNKEIKKIELKYYISE